MRPTRPLLALTLALAAPLALTGPLAWAGDGPASLYELPAKDLDGKPAALEQWKGKVVLVVNVASQCGYTPQYAGLQKLHEELAPRGFAVLAFPSNEFGGQEPGSPAEIRAFCSQRYKVGFPLFEKCRTKAGEGQSPVYAFLAQHTRQLPNWNFCKYLVGRDGKPIAFYASKVAPDAKELREAIEKALAADAPAASGDAQEEPAQEEPAEEGDEQGD